MGSGGARRSQAASDQAHELLSLTIRQLALLEDRKGPNRLIQGGRELFRDGQTEYVSHAPTDEAEYELDAADVNGNVGVLPFQMLGPVLAQAPDRGVWIDFECDLVSVTFTLDLDFDDCGGQ